MNQAIQRFRKGGAVALKHERELLHRVTVVGLGKTAGIFLFRFFYFLGRYISSNGVITCRIRPGYFPDT